MTTFEAIAGGLALSYLAVVFWTAVRLAWRHSEPRSFPAAIEGLRRKDPKKFRDTVWISRVNGAMCSAMFAGFTVAGPFIAIFAEEGRWFALLYLVFNPLLLYGVLRWWFWGLRSSPG